MIIEMVKTDTCPIGKNAEYAQKLYEMLSLISKEEEEKIILFPNEIKGGGRTTRKRRTRRTRRNKKQRKTQRR